MFATFSFIGNNQDLMKMEISLKVGTYHTVLHTKHDTTVLSTADEYN